MSIKIENGVKKRFDGEGSLFGNLHREQLDKKYGMFDIDAMSAEAKVKLELTNEEIGFIEYRTDFNNSDVKFSALFEIKFRGSDYVKAALQCKIGTATFAQKMMCKKLGMRYFFVVQTNGELPFLFIEILDDGYKQIGYLRSAKDMQFFWKNVLRL